MDNAFGATRGKYERLLEGVGPGRLHVFNNEEDHLFGGKNVEPSVENFRRLQAQMRDSRARLVVGFMNDGDGDRFIGGGREAVLVMNRFGPLVVRFLVRDYDRGTSMMAPPSAGLPHGGSPFGGFRRIVVLTSEAGLGRIQTDSDKPRRHLETTVRLLTVKEACDRLRISRATFYKLVRSGSIPLVKVGGKSLVAEASLYTLIEAPPPRRGGNGQAWARYHDQLLALGLTVPESRSPIVAPRFSDFEPAEMLGKPASALITEERAAR